MSSETKDRSDRLTTWLVGGSLVVALAFVLVAYAYSWPLKVAGGGLQVLGIMLAGLGVNVVRSWLKVLAEKTKALAEKAKDLAETTRRVLTQVVESLRLAGITRPHGDAHGVIDASQLGEDDEHTPEGAMLRDLNEAVDCLRRDLQTVISQLKAERIEWEERLVEQREQLGAGMETALRQGWPLILAGLAYSAIGTVVGMFG